MLLVFVSLACVLGSSKMALPTMEWNGLPLSNELLLFGADLALADVDCFELGVVDGNLATLLQDDVFSVCSAGTEDSGTSSPTLLRHEKVKI